MSTSDTTTNENVTDWTALYQPVIAPGGRTNPSKSGFATREEAMAYALDDMCDTCKEERRKALAGEEQDEEFEFRPLKYPGCFYEWLFVPTSSLDKPYEEIMEDAGWKLVYSKIPEQKEDTK
jgi:hypothetical protein